MYHYLRIIFFIIILPIYASTQELELPELPALPSLDAPPSPGQESLNIELPELPSLPDPESITATPDLPPPPDMDPIQAPSIPELPDLQAPSTDIVPEEIAEPTLPPIDTPAMDAPSEELPPEIPAPMVTELPSVPDTADAMPVPVPEPIETEAPQPAIPEAPALPPLDTATPAIPVPPTPEPPSPAPEAVSIDSADEPGIIPDWLSGSITPDQEEAEEEAPEETDASPTYTKEQYAELRKKVIGSCNAFEQNILSCTPFNCKQPNLGAESKDDPEYDIERTIAGKQADRCVYSEKLTDAIWLECQYTEESQKKAARAFQVTYPRKPEDALLEDPASIEIPKEECQYVTFEGKNLTEDEYFQINSIPRHVSLYGDQETPEGDCKDLQEKLKTCEPFYCKGTDPVQLETFNREVTVERKIFQFEKGNACYYLEKFENKPMTGCRFSLEADPSTARCSFAHRIDIALETGVIKASEAEQAAALGTGKKKKDKVNKSPLSGVRPNLNYRVQILPSLIYKREYDDKNKHLPTFRATDEYRHLAFKAIEKKEMATFYSTIAQLQRIHPYGLNVRYINGNTLLIHSAMMGNIDMMRTLLGRGVSPHDQNNAGNTALHVAIFSNRADMVELLTNMGADPFITDNYGRNAFYFAAQTKNPLISKLLGR